MLGINPASCDQRLGQRDHHLRVIGVRAPTTACLDHVHIFRNHRVRKPLERHPQSVARKRPEQRSAGAISDAPRSVSPIDTFVHPQEDDACNEMRRTTCHTRPSVTGLGEFVDRNLGSVVLRRSGCFPCRGVTPHL